MTLTGAVPAVSDNHNKGSLIVPGVRDIRPEVTTNPKILSLRASEKVRSTVKLQVRFIQETECKIGDSLTSIVQNEIADRIAASGAAERLKGRFQADIESVNRATLYEGDVPLRNCTVARNTPSDKAYARKKKAAIDKLKARGFVALKPVFETFGTIKIKMTPWVRKIGGSGTDFGEIRGRVDLKLAANIDTNTFIYKGKFKTVAGPKFEVSNPPPRGPDRRRAKKQYDAFKKRFDEAYKKLKKKLEFEARLFKSIKKVREFKFYSKVGQKVTRQKRLSIPFMGSRQKFGIKVVLTAGEWRDKFSTEGAGEAPKPYKDFDKND